MNNRGFTLIEMIVVLAVLAIMLAIAAPAVNDWRTSARYKEVARGVLVGLREARSLAITNNQNVTAIIDIDNHQLSYGTVTRELSDDVGLETKINDGDTWTATNGADTSNRAVTFRPNGSCWNTFFVRVNADDELKISIDSSSAGLARLP